MKDFRIPAHEIWLLKNEKARAIVEKGLKDARTGNLIRPKEDFLKYISGE